jgi:hypothetical protein
MIARLLPLSTKSLSFIRHFYGNCQRQSKLQGLGTPGGPFCIIFTHRLANYERNVSTNHITEINGRCQVKLLHQALNFRCSKIFLGHCYLKVNFYIRVVLFVVTEIQEMCYYCSEEEKVSEPGNLVPRISQNFLGDLHFC